MTDHTRNLEIRIQASEMFDITFSTGRARTIIVSPALGIGISDVPVRRHQASSAKGEEESDDE
jgi:hypothetical protein